jgi:hypothetical protein
MRKSLCYLSQMRVESFISPAVFPVRSNLPFCIAEDGAEPLLYSDSVDKFFFDCMDASLRRVSPDAQDVREICDLNQAHLTFPVQFY